MQIIPAILATSEEDFERELREIEEEGDFKWVHIDICDGKFVETKTVGVEVLENFPTKLKVELHLMVEDPQELVRNLKVDRVVSHVEVEKPEYLAGQLGLAFNPETPLSGQLGNLNSILIMGVHPGKQGQEFLPETLEKVKESSRVRPNNNGSFLIGVDGGVSAENIREIMEAGADYVVVGSHLLKGNINENLKRLKEKIS